SPVQVAISLKPASRNRLDRLDPSKRCLRVSCRGDGRDRSDATVSPVRLLDRELPVEPRQEPTFFDRAAARDGAVRVVQRSRWRAEHHDCMVAATVSDTRQPGAGPVEVASIRYRYQPEVALG